MRIGMGHVLALLCVLLAPRASCEAAACKTGFKTGPTFQVGPNLGANALADLDGDGNLDLLTGAGYLLGDGKGGFSSPTDLRGVPGPTFDVIPRDLDRDGRLDLILIPFCGREAYVMFGRQAGDGGAYLFEDAVVLPSAECTWHMAAIDVDEDGFCDFVVSGMSQQLFVHRNNGDRTFRPGVDVRLPAPMIAYTLAVADFDGDGHADIAASGMNQATVLFGDGAGTLRQSEVVDIVTIAGDVIDPHRICAADLDGDGRSEILGVGMMRDPMDPCFLFGYWGKEISPAAGMPARISFSIELSGGGRFLQAADMNRDGALDVVVQGERKDSPGNFIKLFYGVREDGHAFDPAAEFGTELSGHGSVLAVGDVNNDAWLDIVLTAEDSEEGEVCLNDARCARDATARGDGNGDGRLDIADAVAILSHLFARGYLVCAPAADANSDTRLDIADPIYILQHLFAAGPPPAAGSVACRS